MWPKRSSDLLVLSENLVDVIVHHGSVEHEPSEQMGSRLNAVVSQNLLGESLSIAIVEQKAVFRCDTEEYLQTELGRPPPSGFSSTKKGTYFKAHGEDAAGALRAHLGLDSSALCGRRVAVARRLGIHVFRRRLSDSNISGVTIHHPSAGACVLVNFDEDPYRQRFTLAHEVGHVYLDSDDDVVVSFAKWDTSDLVEVRGR